MVRRVAFPAVTTVNRPTCKYKWHTNYNVMIGWLKDDREMEGKHGIICWMIWTKWPTAFNIGTYMHEKWLTLEIRIVRLIWSYYNVRERESRLLIKECQPESSQTLRRSRWVWASLPPPCSIPIFMITNMEWELITCRMRECQRQPKCVFYTLICPNIVKIRYKILYNCTFKCIQNIL